MTRWEVIKIVTMMIMTGVLFIIAWELTAVRVIQKQQLEKLIQLSQYLQESDIVLQPYEETQDYYQP